MMYPSKLIFNVHLSFARCYSNEVVSALGYFYLALKQNALFRFIFIADLKTEAIVPWEC
jgi:hypothetical protein